MPCNTECLQKYDCAGIVHPIEGAVFSPYVKLGFGGENKEITVGNNSSEPGNHAVISSFEYGVSEGQGIKAEIYDEKGSDLSKFMDRLSKTLSRAREDFKLFVEFGWIIEDCAGNTKIMKTTDYGGFLWFLPLKLDIAYEHDKGKIRYIISGSDFQDRITENRIEKIEGDERSKIPLKQAIRNLFKNNDPPVDSVKFLKQDGTEWNFKNSDGGPDGPKAVWSGEQQNALATARKWITPLVTENDKGITIEWNCESEVPEIIFWEGVSPTPNENLDCCGSRNLGTYIVNGGDCSPVISFTPSVNWNMAYNGGSGGQAGGGTSGKNVKHKGEKDSKKEQTGTQTSITPNTQDNMWRANDDIVVKAQEAMAAHEKAVRIREIPSSISAELRIQGDPQLVSPILLQGKTISLIVINPFHIMKNQDGCGNWLSEPVCNQIFSNRNWRIEGVNHQISLGQYVTTLKIRLDTPGDNLEPDEPLGGKGCGGYIVENAIPKESN